MWQFSRPAHLPGFQRRRPFTRVRQPGSVGKRRMRQHGAPERRRFGQNGTPDRLECPFFSFPGPIPARVGVWRGGWPAGADQSAACPGAPCRRSGSALSGAEPTPRPLPNSPVGCRRHVNSRNRSNDQNKERGWGGRSRCSGVASVSCG